MKCARQSDRNYWINFGKRAAHAGKSLEWLLEPVASEPVRALLTEGYKAELQRLARRAGSHPATVND